MSEFGLRTRSVEVEALMSSNANTSGAGMNRTASSSAVAPQSKSPARSFNDTLVVRSHAVTWAKRGVHRRMVTRPCVLQCAPSLGPSINAAMVPPCQMHSCSTVRPLLTHTVQLLFTCNTQVALCVVVFMGLIWLW